MWVGGEPTVLLPLHDRLPTRPPSDVIWDFSGETMGTTWSVRLVPEPAVDDASYRAAIEAELARQVALFSHWDPTSELSRFNAADNGVVPVSEAFLDLIVRCLDFAQATDGAVDPTLGALVNLWGFGPPGPCSKADLPSSSEIEAALAVSGWRRLAVDAAAGTLVQPGGLRLDLSALAKGHAVNAVSARLGALGSTHHLVEIGGELIGRGVKPDGQPWWVEIETPLARPIRAALFHLAVATTGDGVHAFERGGQRYGHTLDGRTGVPINDEVASVTVFADTAFEADAWATALTVIGPEVGLARAASENLAASFVLRRNDGLVERVTPAWAAMAERD